MSFGVYLLGMIHGAGTGSYPPSQGEGKGALILLFFSQHYFDTTLKFPALTLYLMEPVRDAKNETSFQCNCLRLSALGAWPQNRTLWGGPAHVFTIGPTRKLVELNRNKLPLNSEVGEARRQPRSQVLVAPDLEPESLSQVCLDHALSLDNS